MRVAKWKSHETIEIHNTKNDTSERHIIWGLLTCMLTTISGDKHHVQKKGHRGNKGQNFFKC